MPGQPPGRPPVRYPPCPSYAPRPTTCARSPTAWSRRCVEFVRDLSTNIASRHVVNAVVGLARAFGHKTVAEGVEDDETLEILTAFGVDYGQGYAIGRPGPLDQTLYAAD